MQIGISKCDIETEFSTDERVHIVEVSNSDQDELSIARGRVEPGGITQKHKLMGVDERYLITQGKGKMFIGDNEGEEVTKGDVVRIPSGTIQYIENIGEGDLIFFCICTPRFIQSCYVGLE